MVARKRASRSSLVDGLLVDGAEARLELVYQPDDNTVKLTPDQRADGQTYFNFRPPAALLPLLVERLEGYKPGNTVGLHRVVVAVDGRSVVEGEQVHHDDHNHLDNRAENLVPMSKEDHKAHHDKHPRLPDDGQLPLFLDSLYLRVLLKHPGTDPSPGRRPAAVGATNPHGVVNVDGSDDVAASHREQMFGGDLAGDEQLALPLHRKRILYKKELQRFRLRSVAAARARLMLKVVHQLGTQASASQVVAAVTARIGKERAAWNTLGWLVDGGFIELTNSSTYKLTSKAFKIEQVKQPSVS